VYKKKKVLLVKQCAYFHVVCFSVAVLQYYNITRAKGQGPPKEGRQGAEQQNASIFSIKVLKYLNITVKTLAFGACVRECCRK